MNRIQLGTQEAPSSMAPNFSFGNRSITPSMIRQARVCITELGMGMKETEVKFSSPPWKSFTRGSPFSK